MCLRAASLGTRPDGSTKIRAVDDLSRSSCNAAVGWNKKLQYQSLDHFLEVLRECRSHLGEDLQMWKARVAAAIYF